MGKGTKYVSKKANENGLFHYTDEENRIWAELYERQEKALPGLACDEYLEALDKINLPKDRVPQLKEVTETLQKHTGWGVQAVPALINSETFFGLLAERKFPAATFIRTREEFDYLQEPDVFHELFGHCPLLTNQVYADFMQKYGEMALKVSPKQRKYLLRLYWFTVEFGLIKAPKTTEGVRIYGAGIASSVGESKYAVQSGEPDLRPFDPVTMFRTPYRIDMYQPIYYVIESFQQLYDLVDHDLLSAISEAATLGEFEPTYPTDDLPHPKAVTAAGAK